MGEAPENLKDRYIDELKDLWSANDQMQRTLKKLAPKASDKALQNMLAKSVEGIAKHTDILKEPIVAQSEKAEKAHCSMRRSLPSTSA